MGDDRRRVPLVVAVVVLALAGAAVTVAARVALVDSVTVASGSMEQTFTRGDRLLVDETAYLRAGPQRGDVVLHTGYPGSVDVGLGFPDPPPQPLFVARVTAVGGEVIACCDAQGRVTVDGSPLAEDYVFEDDRRSFGPVEVPPGRLFVMGDHRSASSDSRSYLADQAGTVAVGDVRGRLSGPVAARRPWAAAARFGLAGALPLAVLSGLVAHLVLSRRRPANYP